MVNTETKLCRPKIVNYQIIEPPQKWNVFINTPKTIFAFCCSGSLSKNTLYFDKSKNTIEKEYLNLEDKFYIRGSHSQNEVTYAINIVN